jgi:4-hydroxythreonine-4-phosphate dehydrogenase
MSNELPRIGLVLGDCAGIGPEQCARVLHDGRLRHAARLLVVGDRRVLELGMRDAGVSFAMRSYATPPDVDWERPEVPIIDLSNIDPARIPRGQISAESGKLTGDTLAYAIKLALADDLDAITFAPLNKAALHAGGWRFPDELKMFAHLLGHQGYAAEMNVLDHWWMSRATSHVSLRQAIEEIAQERILDALELADRTMRLAGIERPRIAVAALNPHAGENGLFGTEEIEIIRPAVERAAARGIHCQGPFPSDTVYLKVFNGDFDGALAMYHDQGQIATKLKGFSRGVTVTAGLKVTFTTPAHGTAFDIVGRGKANIGAMENAINLAARLATTISMVNSEVPLGRPSA